MQIRISVALAALRNLMPRLIRCVPAALPGFYVPVAGTASAGQTYLLKGINLKNGITVTTVSGFVISSNGSTWASSLSLAKNFNALIYVRMTGAADGSYGGNISHVSGGAKTKNVAVSGQVGSVPVMYNDTDVIYFNDTDFLIFQ